MKKIEIAFIVVTLVCLIIPIAGFKGNQTVSQTENRNLAAKPKLVEESKLNAKFFDETNAYLQDHFGGRTPMISLANFIDQKVFHKKNVNSKAIEGKNGWFYYIQDENFADYQKQNLYNQKELTDFSNKIKKTADWCTQNNIKFLFVICPNKHNVYPENYPFKPVEGISRSDQFVQCFENLNVPYVFSRDYLLSMKDKQEAPLYFETDTHWNELGAYYSFEQISEKIKAMFPQTVFPEIEYENEIIPMTVLGDILPMLNLKTAPSTFVSRKPVNGEYKDYFTFIKNAGTDGVITKNNDSQLPKAIVFRDSFSIYMIQYLSTLFSDAEYIWRNFEENDKAYVLEQKPDIIIFEAVERYSPNIVIE